jgi:hypothetical protein
VAAASCRRETSLVSYRVLTHETDGIILDGHGGFQGLVDVPLDCPTKPCTILHNAVHKIAVKCNPTLPRVSKKPRKVNGATLSPSLLLEKVDGEGKQYFKASLPEHVPTIFTNKCKVVEAIRVILGGTFCAKNKTCLFESKERAEHHLLLSFVVMAGKRPFYTDLVKNAVSDAGGWSLQGYSTIIGYTSQDKQSRLPVVLFYLILPGKEDTGWLYLLRRGLC